MLLKLQKISFKVAKPHHLKEDKALSFFTTVEEIVTKNDTRGTGVAK